MKEKHLETAKYWKGIECLCLSNESIRHNWHFGQATRAVLINNESCQPNLVNNLFISGIYIVYAFKKLKADANKALSNILILMSICTAPFPS